MKIQLSLACLYVVIYLVFAVKLLKWIKMMMEILRKNLESSFDSDTALNAVFIYLFGVLRRFQHCTGHITTGSWNGRGNQYIQFVRVLYCKLSTASNYQLSHLRPCQGSNPGLRGERRECYHSATVAPSLNAVDMLFNIGDKTFVHIEKENAKISTSNNNGPDFSDISNNELVQRLKN